MDCGLKDYMQNSKLTIWLMAMRPKTLMASVAPVMLGTLIAYGDGVHHLPTAFLCLLGALSIQILTNLTNDYFDFKKGTDTAERIGPTRVMAAGLVSSTQMIIAITINLLITILICWQLVNRGGPPILLIGILSVISAFLYTAGPKPLAYVGLGEVFVLIFFGPVAVAGTYYLQSLELNTAVVLAGLGPGLLSAAILTINNLRDIDGDRKANKNTLAVRFGRSFALNEYLVCIFTAAVVPVIVYAVMADHLPILTATAIPILAIPTIKTVLTKLDGPSLNEALAQTGKLLFVYSLLLGIGWVL